MQIRRRWKMKANLRFSQNCNVFCCRKCTKVRKRRSGFRKQSFFFLVSQITNSFPSNIFDQKSIYWECLSSIMERMGYDFATICKTYVNVKTGDWIWGIYSIFWTWYIFVCENLESDQCLTTDQTYDASWEIIQAINVSIEAPLH